MATATVDRPAKQGGATASTGEPEVGMVLGKGTLFGRRKPKAHEVSIPGSGVVRLASLTGGHQEEIWKRHEVDGKLMATVSFMAEVVAACLVDSDGTRMFDDILEGSAMVKGLDLGVVRALFDKAASISAMTVEAREELGKGSGEIPD